MDRHDEGDATGSGPDGAEPVMKVARWEGWNGAGREHCLLWRRNGAILVESVVQGSRGGSPYGARYAIECAPDWTVRSLKIASVSGPRLHILSDGNRHWLDFVRGQRSLDHLDGCVDVDVAMTPLTNMLPIKRLGLAEGQGADIRVAYVPLPTDDPVEAWSVEAVEQRYTCIEPERRYLYEGRFRDFSAELEIDSDGFVTDYPGTFRRLHEE